MNPEGPVGRREHEILTAIVESYIATGEPVGSRTLARSNPEGLSPASIRNVMSDLVDSGYLEQPHTSAGRIPTAEAYRYYVEKISGTAKLAPADQGLIDDMLQGVTDAQEFMERTSRVLSVISHHVGVVVTGGGKRNALEHVHFSRLGEQKVLAVVVTKSGVVRDRMLRVKAPLTDVELEGAARYINENFRGWTMEALRAELEMRIERERSEYDQLMRSVEQLYREGALADNEPLLNVYMEGAANLVASEEDRERLQQLLKTLEAKQKVGELLSAYVDARQEAVRVVIGLEDAAPYLRNFVLIGAPARVAGEVMGSMAVIGPTRIDYEHTITAVSYIARLFDKVLNET
ncbi:MAG TPA: heat-inducible transcriptional repressor HrcA [Terriglobales bacterium]|nr:heat-inducible transcriptional repressor HrcA [Terriglobales bacterium]